jgi:pilus assembly protein CpaE
MQSGDNVMSTSIRETESLSMGALSLVLIGPDEERRRAVAKALAGPQASIARELTRYPQVDDLTEIIEADHDVLIIDLDPNPERALDVVENVCGQDSSVTVMVYSAHSDPELLVRCMRAGAREFLTEPVLPTSVGEALVRASVRRDEVRRQKKTTGKLLVFTGAKGGSGVTTVASNFAVALARQSEAKAALLDFDLQLGDAALILGLTTKFSALDALENTTRLDSDFLSVLLAKHSSGLSVLAAPDTIPSLQPSKNGIEKLLRVARENFPYVVLDAGSHSIDMYEALFEMASTVYLVTQVSVADLRNSNRFVSRYFNGPDSKKLEIVLNRFLARHADIDESAITKALTRPARWKIPNDFAAAQRAQNTGIAMAMEKNQVSRAFAEMASAASGHIASAGKKKKFGLF